MEILILSFITALGKIVLISRTVTIRRALRWEKWLDVLFAIVVPLMFLGTFHGALLAACSGLWFSVMLRVSRLFVTKEPKSHVPYSSVRRRQYR